MRLALAFCSLFLMLSIHSEAAALSSGRDLPPQAAVLDAHTGRPFVPPRREDWRATEWFSGFDAERCRPAVGSNEATIAAAATEKPDRQESGPVVNFGSQVPFTEYALRWLVGAGVSARAMGEGRPHHVVAAGIEPGPIAVWPAGPRCGDGICQASEDSGKCRADCRRLAPLPGAGRIVERSLAPRGVKLADGSVLIGLKRSLADQNVIQAMVSSQKGDGWQVRGTVEDSRSAEAGDLGNPMPFRERQGRLLMAFRDHQSAMDDKERLYQLRVEFSEDEGFSWQRWRVGGDGVIDRSPYGLWEPFLYYDAHGDLRVVYAKERAPQWCKGRPVKKQDIVTKFSRDGGRTWVGEAVVASAGLSRDGVPSVARLRDGSFVLVFESWRDEVCESLNPKLVIRSMQSRDGVTWDKRRALYVPRAAKRPSSAAWGEAVASWPYVVALRDGRVLVVFTTDEDRALARERGAARDRDFDIKFVLTKHEATYESLEWEEAGAQLAYAMTAADDEVRYASAVELDDGNVLLLFARPARYGILQLH